MHYSDLLLFSIPFDFSIGIFTLNAVYLYCECNKKTTNRTSMSAITKISVPMRICKCHFLDFFIFLQKNVETHNSFVIFLNTFFLVSNGNNKMYPAVILYHVRLLWNYAKSFLQIPLLQSSQIYFWNLRILHFLINLQTYLLSAVI